MGLLRLREEFINKYLHIIFRENFSLTLGVKFCTKDVPFSGDIT